MNNFAEFKPIVIKNDPQDARDYYIQNNIPLPDNNYFSEYIAVAENNNEQEEPEVVFNKDFFNVPYKYKPKKVLISKTQINPPYRGKYNIIIGAKNSIADRHNNPGNLIFKGQEGATKGEAKKYKDKDGKWIDSGSYWAKFDSVEDGWNALKRQVEIDKERKLDLTSFINKYAPNFENDTTSYINKIVNTLNVKRDIDINKIATFDLAKVIAQIESGTKVKPNY